jgi:type II secretory pathway component PulJ
MRTWWRDERGTTVMELLVAMTLLTIVFSATLLLFEAGADNHRLVEEHNEAQDVARRHTDRLSRELRNMASPSLLTASAAQPLAVDVAGPYDLVFRVVDDVRPAASANSTNVKRVRYCLDAADPANGRLYRQEQIWLTNGTPLMPSTTACPGTGWTTQTLVAEAVVNRIDGQNRPLFMFDSADTARITRVRTDVHVDPTPDRRPAEARLTSGVFLRNQNRVPTASFTVDANAATNEVVLNGSPSEDPEDMPLEYHWFMDGVEIGVGVVFTHTGATDGLHTYRLEVRDPAELSGDTTMEVTL